MFGTYRTLLALLVMLLHYAYVPLIGEYAVFGFFALSGFLMTLIMQVSYGYSAKGIAAYAVNRFLRIYPIYWVAVIVSCVVLLSLDYWQTTGYNSSYYLPETAFQWLRNLALILDFHTSPSLIPPAWALTVELIYYVAIGLGLSRTRGSTITWFVASVLYTGYLLAGDGSWGQRYYSVGAASLPFSTGALIWHVRDELRQGMGFLLERAFTPHILFIGILGNWYLGRLLDTQTGLSFYINYLLCSLMIIALFWRKSLPLVSPKIDAWIGALSYPIYVIHLPLAYVLRYAFRKMGISIPGPEPFFFFISLPFVILAAWAIAATVEAATDSLRQRIKQRAELNRLAR